MCHYLNVIRWLSSMDQLYKPPDIYYLLLKLHIAQTTPFTTGCFQLNVKKVTGPVGLELLMEFHLTSTGVSLNVMSCKKLVTHQS